MAHLSRTDAHFPVSSAHAILPLAGAGHRGPPQLTLHVVPTRQVVPAASGVSLPRAAYLTALTHVRDAASGTPETRARADLAPGGVLVRPRRACAVPPEEERCSEQKQLHRNQRGAKKLEQVKVYIKCYIAWDKKKKQH